MPIYDCDRPLGTLREWEKTRRCSCGATLIVAWGGSYGYNGYWLRCTKDATHNTIVRLSEPSVSALAQRENMIPTATGRDGNQSKLAKPEAVGPQEAALPDEDGPEEPPTGGGEAPQPELSLP